MVNRCLEEDNYRRLYTCINGKKIKVAQTTLERAITENKCQSKPLVLFCGGQVYIRCPLSIIHIKAGLQQDTFIGKFGNELHTRTH